MLVETLVFYGHQRFFHKVREILTIRFFIAELAQFRSIAGIDHSLFLNLIKPYCLLPKREPLYVDDLRDLYIYDIIYNRHIIE